ncbi:uncharacterized protein LOC122046658 [Zingiber officinale]|uniref:Uncharacterized protein n=1 Tax=Zingiber officinale TaxID=94328 RepID=A0A8J5I9A4_ZINOF|nr:uncharacterized protein LOC122046658 [Zingiber officinale]KAG6530911.1 hypothetical protein ZIOFF_004678 [Zingiber officinale]
MATRPSLSLVAVFLLLLFAAASPDCDALSLPFNSSFFVLYNSSTLAPPPPDSPPGPGPFLREVVRALVDRDLWEPEAKVRVVDLGGGRARVGSRQKYQFHVRVGRRALILKFYDEDVEWNEVDGAVIEFGSDVAAGDAVAGLRPTVRGFELIGPLELRVGSDVGDDDRMSLHLTSSNVTLSDIRHINIGRGIKVKIEGAEGISLTHPYDIGLSLNGSLTSRVEDHSEFWELGYSTCAPLLTVNVIGPASVLAYSSDNSFENIEVAFLANDTIDLLPVRCYREDHAKQISSCSFCAVSSKLGLLDKLLRGFLGSMSYHNTSIRFTKAKITSEIVVKFQLQLENDVSNDNGNSEKVSNWKQKPKVSQVWLETTARVEGERKLRPVLVKNLKKPYIIADSISWSSLLSNISFTNLPSLVVPPEALTLDVKW